MTRSVVVSVLLVACGSRTGMDLDPPVSRDAGEADVVVLPPPPFDAGPPGTMRFIEIELAPAPRVQLAVWIEHEETERFVTIALTEAVAYRGIGNRPGASQMNSGFRWPYGRREGVLPYWAHRRIARGGAPFPRVVAQSGSEGLASQPGDASSVDAYFCLGFDATASGRDGLDAVTCASVFNGDRGRFLTDEDVASGYSEPWEEGGAGSMRPLSLDSMYPPRGDVLSLGANDHPDVGRYADARRAAMPELDAVTTATLPSDVLHRFVYELPAKLPNGTYRVYVEANTEGDYNEAHGPAQYPTPTLPAGAWDHWAESYGYPFRGQPAVVFRVDIDVAPPAAQSASASAPVGRMLVDGLDDALLPMDGTISDDATALPGSGADRIRRQSDGTLVRVRSGVR